MKNRYFSVENQVQETQESSNQSDSDINAGVIHPDDMDPNYKKETEEKTESPAFLQRRDYLLKKLMKSQTLPGLEESEAKEKILQESTTIEPINNEFKMTKPPARERKFLDDYIPLFGSSVKRKQPEESDDEESKEIEANVKSDSSSSDCDIQIISDKEYNPQLDTIENYRGPYPTECLKRSRRTLIEEFLPNSKATNRSNFFDRRFEILKMKLKIKSKFDKDNRLWNKIRRETAQIKQDVYDRTTARDRRFEYYMNKNIKKNQVIKFSDSDDDDILFFDDKNYEKTKPSTSKDVIKLSNRKSIKSINLDDTLSNSGSGSDTMNEEDVIKMITQPEYCLNVTESDSEDSKCKQFGKYATKKQPKKKPKSSDPSLKRQDKKRKPAKKKPNDIEQNFRIDRVGLKAGVDDEYDDLKNRYKTIRNKRNKVLRKKKGMSIEIERKIMSDELKQIRNQMKKLRRKKKLTMDKSAIESYNPLDMVRNADSKKPKKKKNSKKKDFSEKIAIQKAIKAEKKKSIRTKKRKLEKSGKKNKKDSGLTLI